MKGDPYKHHDQKLLCSLYIPSLLGSTGKTHYKLIYVPANIVCQQIWDSIWLTFVIKCNEFIKERNFSIHFKEKTL